MKPRSKSQIQKDVTSQYLALADFVVRKTGPVKTYGEFCRLTGMNQQNFSPLCKGERFVQMEVAIRACEVFGASLEVMFGGGDITEGVEVVLKEMKPRRLRKVA